MATIIKASQSTLSDASSVRHVAFNFDDMSAQANQYLDQVRVEAAKLLADAQQQADVIRQQAEHEGQQAAIKAVERMMEEKLAAKMQSLLPAMQEFVDQLNHSKQAWATHWKQSAVSVASAIAARVIRRELSQTPEISLDLIAEALQLAAGSPEIVVHMNPRDVETLGEQVEKLTDALRPVSAVRLAGDDDVSLGGCRVETRFGVIDQQIESQLSRIEEELA